jgi:predicted 2-oxoglutarate/Fe(II)-dependent dioxygenase YbiX
MIKVIENFLTEEECSQIIKSNETQLKHTNLVTETNHTPYNTSKRESLTTYTDVDTLEEKVTSIVSQDYEGLRINIPVERLPFELIKYEIGHHFEWHTDVVNKKRTREVVSCIIFLNNQYKGGNLLIKEGNVTHIITKKTGTLCIFPSKYRHKVTKVEAGDRYTLCCWYHKSLQHKKLAI